ncbi:MAG TPA: LysR family transcriptional regulator [Byssovorax sp.]
MSTELPSLESLRCFLAAARVLNFRAAARAVGLTPAALGQRVRQLEEQLEVTLFERTTRSVRLTAAGLALVPSADRALAAAATCVRAARGEEGAAPFDLVLGTRQELGMSWIVPSVDRIEAAVPAMSLHLYFGSGPDLLLRVRTLEIDCAITSSRYTDPKLDALRLHREDYVLVGAPKLLDRTPLLRDDDARAHVLLDISADMPLYRYFRDAPGGGDRLRFGRVTRLGSIEAIRARALAGAGVAVLPHYLVEKDLARRAFRRLLPKTPLLHDWFRLVFRADDARRSVYERLAATMLALPLR